MSRLRVRAPSDTTARCVCVFSIHPAGLSQATPRIRPELAVGETVILLTPPLHHY